MKHKLLTLGGLLAVATLTAGLFIGPAIGDGRYERDEHEEHEGREGRWGALLQSSRLDVAPADNPMYEAECGACHFAYQPGLLPARSWERVMGGLADHFGDNAELEPEIARLIATYLTENAADRSDYRRSVGINGSLRADEAPLRISDTRYFQRKHHEIPPRMVKGNPEVNSWSNCTACHRNAAAGSYNEHEVKIPGVGRWDD